MLVETLVNRPDWFQSVPQAVSDLRVQGHPSSAQVRGRPPPGSGQEELVLVFRFSVCVCV